MLGRVPPGWGARELAAVESFLARAGTLEDQALRAARWRSASSAASGATRPSCWRTSSPAPTRWRRSARPCRWSRGLMDYARFVRLRRPVWDGFERQLAAARDRRGRPATAISRRWPCATARCCTTTPSPLPLSRHRRGAPAARARHRGDAPADRRAGGAAGRPGASSPAPSRAPSSASSASPGWPWPCSSSPPRGGWRSPSSARRWALSLLGPEAVRGLEEGHLWTESLVTTVPPASPPPASPPTTSRWR